MTIFLIIVLLATVIIVAATVRNNKNNHSDFEAKYGLKVVDGDYPCCDCSYFYDGKFDSYPFVPGEERPHPPCCNNKSRCLEDKSKCYDHDRL